MPMVMLRKQDDILTLYIAKKDLEAKVVSIEQDSPESWGGELELDDGSKYYIEPQSPAPSLPISLRAKRVDS